MKFLKTLVLTMFFLSLPFMTQAQEISKINFQNLNTIIEANKGRVLVVSFWATWCTPCVQEFPGLVAVRQQYSDQDLEIVAVSVDSNARMVENFLLKNKSNFPIYLDDGEISHTLGIRSIPRTLIFARSGQKVLDHLGYISQENLAHVIEKVRSMS